MADHSDMRLVICVIDEGSFSAAARKLGQTPAAVGKRVRALEQRLGIDLIVRSTRKMALTEAGQRYVEDAREIVAQIDALEEDLRDDASTLRGTVRLTAPTAYGQRFVLPAVTDFMSRHPTLEVQLSFTDKVIDLVGDGVDLAIRTGVAVDSSLIGRRIGPYRRQICASPDYLGRHEAPLSPADLTGHRCLKLPRETVLSDWLLNDGVRQGTRLGAGLTCNSLDALAFACVIGQGIASIPDFIATQPLKEGQLVPLLADHTKSEPDEDIMLLRPANPVTPRRVRALGEFLFSRLRQ